MSDDYKPVEISSIFPDLDIEELKKSLDLKRQPQQPKTKTLDFLISELSISHESIKNKDVFLRNYIYSMVIARKHLLEIDTRLKDIRQ